mgnify:CR=1 FL=1
MCLICIDLEREKLTSLEARKNLGEIYTSMEKEHIYEVIKRIWQREDKEFKDFQDYMRTCEG